MADEAVLFPSLQMNHMNDFPEIRQEGPPLAWLEATQYSLCLEFLAHFLLVYFQLAHNPVQYKRMHQPI